MRNTTMHTITLSAALALSAACDTPGAGPLAESGGGAFEEDGDCLCDQDESTD